MSADEADYEVDYYMRRAEAELDLAQHAILPKVTAAHYRLSQAYLERVEALRACAAMQDGPQPLTHATDEDAKE